MSETTATAHPSPLRIARCQYCKNTRPSREWAMLPLFEARGEGTPAATDYCKCGYAEIAHRDDSKERRRNVVKEGVCKGFVPHGAYEFDRYYCGCRGWD